MDQISRHNYALLHRTKRMLLQNHAATSKRILPRLDVMYNEITSSGDTQEPLKGACRIELMRASSDLPDPIIDPRGVWFPAPRDVMPLGRPCSHPATLVQGPQAAWRPSVCALPHRGRHASDSFSRPCICAISSSSSGCSMGLIARLRRMLVHDWFREEWGHLPASESEMSSKSGPSEYRYEYCGMVSVRGGWLRGLWRAL